MKLLAFDTTRPPMGWECLQVSLDGAKFRRILTDHTVIVSHDREDDGKQWAHFSMAHPKRLPTWDELVDAKEKFLGVESKAIQVLAPRSEWVNIHPHCLHLFVCLDGDALPDFTRGGGSL